jgi:hypothetical protein
MANRYRKPRGWEVLVDTGGVKREYFPGETPREVAQNCADFIGWKEELKECDFFELADIIVYFRPSLGNHTGAYRYKRVKA